MSIRFIFGSSMIYVGVIAIERVAGLLLFPMMTRILTPRDYGVMLLVGNGATLVNLMFGSSLTQALPTLFSNATSDVTRRAVSTTILLSAMVLQAAVYGTLVLLSREISVYFTHTPDYATAIALGAMSSLLNSWALCLVVILRLTERHKLYPKVQLPTLVILVGIILAFIVSGSLTVSSQYVAGVVAWLFASIVYAFTLKHWLTGRFELRQLATAGRIGLQLLPWQFAIVLTTNSAAFFLTRSGHLDDAGLFLVAYAAAGLLVMGSSGFESVWTPFVLLRKDQPDLADIQVRTFSLYSSAMLMAASSLCLFAHELFLVLAGPSFREGYLFVPALSLAFCLFCFANSFAQGIQARQRMAHYAWIGIATSIVFLAVVLSLVGKMGAWGVVAAMNAGFFTMLLLVQLTSRRFMPVAYPWTRHVLMWVIAGIIVALTYRLDIGWLSEAVKLTALAAILALPFLFGAVRLSDIRFAKDSLFGIFGRQMPDR